MSSDLKVVASEKQDNPEPKAAEKTVTDKNVMKKKVLVKKDTSSPPEIEDSYLGGDFSSATIKKLRESPESISKLFKDVVRRLRERWDSI